MINFIVQSGSNTMHFLTYNYTPNIFYWLYFLNCERVIDCIKESICMDFFNSGLCFHLEESTFFMLITKKVIQK